MYIYICIYIYIYVYEYIYIYMYIYTYRRIAMEGQLACLMNAESGLFIEIPNCNSGCAVDDFYSTSTMPSVRYVYMYIYIYISIIFIYIYMYIYMYNIYIYICIYIHIYSEFQVDFMCEEMCSYELWHGVKIIKSGTGYQDILNEIVIKVYIYVCMYTYVCI
jgi:hypothetical protein